uniref:Uncharacterized protein n=1 Tax=Zea mays TaxID=4577 RepID=C4J592_MAIZE|nr:unknown [Zea mays]ACR36820.1 unknown [Zea mays]
MPHLQEDRQTWSRRSAADHGVRRGLRGECGGSLPDACRGCCHGRRSRRRRRGLPYRQLHFADPPPSRGQLPGGWAAHSRGRGRQLPEPASRGSQGSCSNRHHQAAPRPVLHHPVQLARRVGTHDSSAGKEVPWVQQRHH